MVKSAGTGVVRDAIRDVNDIRELAVRAAQERLVESLAPAVRELINRELRGEGTDRVKAAEDGHFVNKTWEESAEGDAGMATKVKEQAQLDVESLAAMFPNVSEKKDEEPELPPEGDLDELPPEGEPEPDGDELPPEKGEDEEELEDAKDPMIPELQDEEIEISEAELRKVFDAARVVEATVSKGFKDMTPAGELDDVDPAAGIADVKKGEQYHDQVEPPAKKDWTVKEVRSLINAGYRENKALREQNSKLANAVRVLSKTLAETNLFNSKILHVNRLLTNHRLTLEQKRAVIRQVDEGATISEVKKIGAALEASFRTSGAVNESRRPTARAARATAPGSRPEVIREGVERASGTGQNDRWLELAGLNELVK